MFLMVHFLDNLWYPFKDMLLCLHVKAASCSVNNFKKIILIINNYSTLYKI